MTDSPRTPIPSDITDELIATWMFHLGESQSYVVRTNESFKCFDSESGEEIWTTIDSIRCNDNIIPANDSHYPAFDEIDVDLVILDEDGDTFDSLDCWAFKRWDEANQFIEAICKALGCESESIDE